MAFQLHRAYAPTNSKLDENASVDVIVLDMPEPEPLPPPLDETKDLSTPKAVGNSDPPDIQKVVRDPGQPFRRFERSHASRSEGSEANRLEPSM